MSAGADLFGEFLARFAELKAATKDSPQRLVAFFDESLDVRSAAGNLEAFLVRNDFERTVFHGPRKQFAQVPAAFEREWQAFQHDWLPALNHVIMRLIEPDWSEQYDPAEKGPPKPVPLDPEIDDAFVPEYHEPASGIRLGLDVLNDMAQTGVGEPVVRNSARITLDILDYIENTVGFNLEAVLTRWRKLPIIFMPAHVSNRHGLTEKGSLLDLIDDAAKAYVSGAPAAAIAMCRAALEMVLKQHYLPRDCRYIGRDGKERDLPLGELIVLADARFEFVQERRIRPMVDRANAILHGYTRIQRVSEEEDQAILGFLKTVKFLIQRAPARP